MFEIIVISFWISMGLYFYQKRFREIWAKDKKENEKFNWFVALLMLSFFLIGGPLLIFFPAIRR